VLPGCPSYWAPRRAKQERGSAARSQPLGESWAAGECGVDRARNVRPHGYVPGESRLGRTLRSATRVSTFGFTAGPQLRTTLSEGRGYGEAGGEGVVPPLPQADEGCCQLMFRRQTKIYKLQAETFRSARLAPTAGNAPACSGKVCASPSRLDSVAPAGWLEPAGGRKDRAPKGMASRVSQGPSAHPFG